MRAQGTASVGVICTGVSGQAGVEVGGVRRGRLDGGAEQGEEAAVGRSELAQEHGSRAVGSRTYEPPLRLLGYFDQLADKVRRLTDGGESGLSLSGARSLASPSGPSSGGVSAHQTRLCAPALLLTRFFDTKPNQLRRLLSDFSRPCADRHARPLWRASIPAFPNVSSAEATLHHRPHPYTGVHHSQPNQQLFISRQAQLLRRPDAHARRPRRGLLGPLGRVLLRTGSHAASTADDARRRSREEP